MCSRSRNTQECPIDVRRDAILYTHRNRVYVIVFAAHAGSGSGKSNPASQPQRPMRQSDHRVLSCAPITYLIASQSRAGCTANDNNRLRRFSTTWLHLRACSPQISALEQSLSSMLWGSHGSAVPFEIPRDQKPLVVLCYTTVIGIQVISSGG